MNPLEIYVYCKECQTKDGKKFKAFETVDTKDKKRLSVAFLQSGDKPLEQSARIRITAARVDESKRFPVLRIEHYEVLDTENKKNDNTYKYFN